MKRGRYINFNANNRLRAVAKLYAHMLLVGTIDYNILYIASYNSDRQQCILTIPSPQQLLIRVKRVLNNERLQTMLAKELLKIMKETGFSVADAINYRKQILIKAIELKQLAIANKTLDSLDNKLGIGDNQQQQPLLEANGDGINFDHLARVKKVNYVEIKQSRDNNQLKAN